MIRLAVRVRREQAELALAELLELAPGGVEEVDVDADTVEYAVYGATGELPSLPALTAAAGPALVELTTTEVADDWVDRWRAFHRPLVLGDRLVVRPPWEPRRPAAAVDLVIEPGRAFGTGAHATTRLCLELLLELQPPARPGLPSPERPVVSGTTGLSSGPPTAIDLGCGSGVLAIAAARLGWRPVLALDLDPLAIEATLANASANGVAESVSTRRFDVRTEPVPAAPLVLANLLAPLLLRWCSQLPAAAGVPGPGVTAELPRRVIAGGLLVSEADAVAEAFAGAGLGEQDRRVRGEWAALSLAPGDLG